MKQPTLHDGATHGVLKSQLYVRVWGVDVQLQERQFAIFGQDIQQLLTDIHVTVGQQQVIEATLEPFHTFERHTYPVNVKGEVKILICIWHSGGVYWNTVMAMQEVTDVSILFDCTLNRVVVGNANIHKTVSFDMLPSLRLSENELCFSFFFPIPL
ncbi:hypothetical protein SJ928_14370 [Enterococcus faecium]